MKCECLREEFNTLQIDDKYAFRECNLICRLQGCRFWENMLDSFSSFYIELAFSNFIFCATDTLSFLVHQFQQKTSTTQENQTDLTFVRVLQVQNVLHLASVLMKKWSLMKTLLKHVLRMKKSRFAEKTVHCT